MPVLRRLILILCIGCTHLQGSTNIEEGIILSYDEARGILTLKVAFSLHAAERDLNKWERNVTLKVDSQTLCSLDGIAVKPAVALKPGRFITVWGKGRGSSLNIACVLSEASSFTYGKVQSLVDGKLVLRWSMPTDHLDQTVTLDEDVRYEGGSKADLLAHGTLVRVSPKRSKTIYAYSVASLPADEVRSQKKGRQNTCWGVITEARTVFGKGERQVDGFVGHMYDASGWSQIEVPVTDGKTPMILLNYSKKSDDFKNAELRKRLLRTGSRFVAFCYRNRAWPSAIHFIDDDGKFGEVAVIEADSIALKDPVADTSSRHAISKDCTVVIDGEQSSPDKLSPGMLVLAFEARPQVVALHR